MKKYKTGDTIYLKGTVRSVDDTALPYCVYFRNYNTVWVTSDNIIDELPTVEPVKPVLPKEVADELEDAKARNLDFIGYMNTTIDDDYPATNMFTYGNDRSSVFIKILSDAWHNGYTVEAEKKYNLVLGADSRNNRVCVYHIANETRMDGFTIEPDLDSSQYQFTQSEIDKYNKDFWIKNIDLNDYKVEVTADIQTKEVEK